MLSYYTSAGDCKLDGATLTKMDGNWINIDNAVGIVTPAYRQFAFGEKANNNSVMTAKLYTLYSDQSHSVKAGEAVARRAVAYYSNMDATTTGQMAEKIGQLSTPEGWNGVIAFDPDQTGYLLLSNFASDQKCQIADLRTQQGCPVFSVRTQISSTGSTAAFLAEENHSVSNVLRFFIEGTGLEAVQDKDDDNVIYLLNQIKGQNPVTVNALDNGNKLSKQIELSTKVLKVSIRGGELLVEEATGFPEETAENLTEGYKEITNERLMEMLLVMQEPLILVTLTQ